MDIKQIITATVAVILICLVAIPLIQTSSEGIYTTENNTTEKFMMATATDEPITLEFNNNSYKVNGVEIPIPVNTTYRIKAFWPGAYLKAPNTAMIEVNETGNSRISGVTKLVYEPTAETITYTTSSGDTVIENVPYFYYYNDKGDYGLFGGETYILNINKNTDYFVFCDDTFKAGVGFFKSSYVYNNNDVKEILMDPMYSPAGNLDYQDTTISFDLNYTEIDSYHFTVEPSPTFSVNGTEINSNTNISIIAPIEYKYVSDNDSIVITILDLIPILLIAAVLIGIGYSLMRRD